MLSKLNFKKKKKSEINFPGDRLFMKSLVLTFQICINRLQFETLIVTSIRSYCVFFPYSQGICFTASLEWDNVTSIILSSSGWSWTYKTMHVLCILFNLKSALSGWSQFHGFMPKCPPNAALISLYGWNQDHSEKLI